MDCNGNEVGSVCGMLGVDREAGGYEDGVGDFIVVGRRQILDFKSELVVLQVEKDKQGIVWRVNQGEIDEEAWVDAKHEWRLVALG